MRKLVLLVSMLAAFPCFAQAPSPDAVTPKSCPAPSVTKTQSKEKVEQPDGTADLPSVIAAVQAAIKCYQDNAGVGPDALPTLQKAVFDFQTTTGKVGGINVSFFIFKIQAQHENDATRDTSFTYSRKTGGGQPLRTKTPYQPLSDALVSSMQTAAAAVKSASTMADLKFSELTMKVEFGIKFQGNVALSAPVELVTLGPNVQYNKNEVQSVTLTFGPQ